MKPIEIHIEGYKIIIMEDKEPEVTEEKEDKITYVPYPVYPTTPQQPDWWKQPYVTRTAGSITNTTTTAHETPILDAMIGKKVTDEDA